MGILLLKSQQNKLFRLRLIRERKKLKEKREKSIIIELISNLRQQHTFVHANKAI